jgi:2-methylcitrate dehydratase PrpD
MVPQVLSITLRDGRTLVEPVEAVLGSPERPLSHSQHLQKFARCASAGAQPLASERIKAIIHAVDQLEELADMRDLVNLCVSS